MKENIQFVILQRVDLMTVNPPMVYAQTLELHNHAAHEWRVQVVANSQPVDLTGCTVACYAARSDKKTVYIKGTANDSVASVVFDSAFYAINGELAARMELSGGDGRVLAVARLLCTVSQTGTDTVIDPSGEIPSLDNLMAMIDEVKTATNAANEAAQEAQRVADEIVAKAPYIGGNGRWYVWNEELGAYADSGVSATGPQGVPGNTPYIGDNGNWWIGSTDTGTSASGAGGGVADSVAWGNVTGKPDTYPPASHTHSEYLGKNETAVNANQLNGKSADQYALKSDLPTKASDVGALAEDAQAADSAKLGGLTADQVAGKAIYESGDGYVKFIDGTMIKWGTLTYNVSGYGNYGDNAYYYIVGSIEAPVSDFILNETNDVVFSCYPTYNTDACPIGAFMWAGETPGTVNVHGVSLTNTVGAYETWWTAVGKWK